MKTPLSALICCVLSLPLVAAADGSDPELEPMARGNNLVQIGYFHVDTLDTSNPLHTQLKPGAAALLGVQSDFTSPGTSARVSSADTLAIIDSYLITDHIGLKFEGGIPAQFKLYGNGTVAPTGAVGDILNVNLGTPAYNPLAKVTQWSPVAMVTYYFREPTEPIRPYVGLGATYTWFTNVKLNSQFKDQLNSQFGTPLALANGSTDGTHVTASAKSDFAPAFNLGVVADLTPKWSLSGSVSFSLLSTTATIKIDDDNGNRLVTSQTKIDLNPLVLALLLGYRFNL